MLHDFYCPFESSCNIFSPDSLFVDTLCLLSQSCGFAFMRENGKGNLCTNGGDFVLSQIPPGYLAVLKAGPRLCEIVLRGQREPGGGIHATQPNAHMLAHICNITTATFCGFKLK